MLIFILFSPLSPVSIFHVVKLKRKGKRKGTVTVLEKAGTYYSFIKMADYCDLRRSTEPIYAGAVQRYGERYLSVMLLEIIILKLLIFKFCENPSGRF
jgi:hypothetical protein